MKNSYQARNGNLDAMRAIAVLLVVLAHLKIRNIPGGSGVTIFFVISGFIITKLMIREFELTSKFSLLSFGMRRFLKIFPPLFAIIILPSLVIHFTLGNEWIDSKVILRQTFFIYNWHNMSSGSSGAIPGSEVVWSLSIEEQFYICLAVIWFFLHRRKSPEKTLMYITASVWLLSTLARSLYSLENLVRDLTDNVPRIYYGTDTRASSLAAGVILALILQNRSGSRSLDKVNELIKSRYSFWLAIGIFVASLLFRDPFFRDTLRFTIQELATMLVIGGALNEGSWPRIIRKIAERRVVSLIGLSSYCIYLSHLILINFGSKVVELESIVGKFLLFVVSMLVGIVAYLTLDKPFEKVRSRYRRV
jgi:peptidoglycan/LPS O-acetylase OafA/YrhL